MGDCETANERSAAAAAATATASAIETASGELIHRVCFDDYVLQVTAAPLRHLSFVRLVGTDAVPFDKLRQCALFSPAVYTRRARTRLHTADALKPWSTIPYDVTIQVCWSFCFGF